MRARLSPRFITTFGFVLALSSAFLLTTSRERPWTDGSAVYFTAERLLLAGTTHLDFPAVAAPNGTMQSPHPLLVSLVHLPGVVVERLWAPLWRGGQHRLLVLGSHLAPAVLSAGTCWLFLQMCLLLGVRRKVALATTVALAFTTIIWVYARSPWPPATEAFVFCGFFHAALRVLPSADRRRHWGLGLWGLALVNTKWAFVLLLPATAAWFIWRHRTQAAARAGFIRVVLPLWGAGVLVVLLESQLRFGSWAFVPSMVASEPHREHVFMGLWALAFSPGKSLLVYSPPLVLGLLGIRPLWRSAGRDTVLLVLTTLGPFALYLAVLSHWTGDWAWGPRHYVFMTPVLLLPGAVYLDGVLARRRLLALAAVVALAGLGLGVQVLGNAFYWDHHIRIAKQVRAVWLGVPHRAGALAPVRGAECDPCFEDIHPLIWLAPFNPIEGHAWLLRHVLAGHDATKAEVDGAWHRYTALRIPIGEAYARARIDWWFLEFVPRSVGKGIASVLALLGFAWLGIRLGRQRVERSGEA